MAFSLQNVNFNASDSEQERSRPLLPLDGTVVAGLCLAGRGGYQRAAWIRKPKPFNRG